MKDILSEIIANKRFEVDLQKQAISIEQLQEGINEVPASRSMKRALASSDSGIIAEFKRRSPSKGWIKQEARPECRTSYRRRTETGKMSGTGRAGA